MNSPKVIIAGAGCGDPELLTLKTAKYLQQADVILTDYLASTAILDAYARPEAEVVYVGKQCKSGLKTPQSIINDLLVHYAQQGLLVVRLKGGDVSIFSNILDELQTLKAHHIPFEIVPGVTAALGAAAYSGIPLTARGYATAVRFLTFYKSDTIENTHWQDLAQTKDTLVFYMSSDKYQSIAQQLFQNGASTEKKIALIEQASTPNQQVRIFDIATLANTNLAKVMSPALLVVGTVVNLHHEYSWFEGADCHKNYFTENPSFIKHTTTNLE